MDACQALKVIRHALHDLAQPLAAVTGLVDLLLLDQRGNCGHGEEIQLISEKLEEVLEIISHIRDTARQAVPDVGEEAQVLEGRVN